MCIHIYGSWLAISSSKSMNNVKPDCCKVVDFYSLAPSPMTIYSRSLTLLKIGCFSFMIFLMLIVILEWQGGAIGFAKWKYCTGSIMLTMGACFPRQRPNYWYQDEEGGDGQRWTAGEGGNWIRPSGLGRRQPQLQKSPGPWPWLDRASGLTSDQFHCCPDPSRQSSIQAPRV